MIVVHNYDTSGKVIFQVFAENDKRGDGRGASIVFKNGVSKPAKTSEIEASMDSKLRNNSSLLFRKPMKSVTRVTL